MTEQRLKWQNLLYKQCPRCGEDMEDERLFLRCPNPHPSEIGKDCFFVKKERAMSMLTEWKVYQHMTPEEKDTIDKALS